MVEVGVPEDIINQVVGPVVVKPKTPEEIAREEELLRAAGEFFPEALEETVTAIPKAIGDIAKTAFEKTRTFFSGLLGR